MKISIPQVTYDTPANGKVSVLLSVEKIIASWASDGLYQRSPNVTSYKHDIPFDVEPKRIESIVGLIQRGEPLPQIDVALSCGKKKGCIFPDGRHRIVIHYLAGVEHIRAQVLEKDAECILSELGLDTPIFNLQSAVDSLNESNKSTSPKMG